MVSGARASRLRHRSILISAGLILIVGVLIISSLKPNAATSAEPQPHMANGILACERVIVSGYALPAPGSEGDEAIYFDSPEAAAQSLYDRYKAAGRVDGRQIGELVKQDDGLFFVASGENESGRGVFQITIEPISGRYAVGSYAMCVDAAPASNIDLAS